MYKRRVEVKIEREGSVKKDESEERSGRDDVRIRVREMC